MGYYGLMRIGEISMGPHVLKAKDIHIATNKQKNYGGFYTVLRLTMQVPDHKKIKIMASLPKRKK